MQKLLSLSYVCMLGGARYTCKKNLGSICQYLYAAIDDMTQIVPKMFLFLHVRLDVSLSRTDECGRHMYTNRTLIFHGSEGDSFLFFAKYKHEKYIDLNTTDANAFNGLIS